MRERGCEGARMPKLIFKLIGLTLGIALIFLPSLCTITFLTNIFLSQTHSDTYLLGSALVILFFPIALPFILLGEHVFNSTFPSYKNYTRIFTGTLMLVFGTIIFYLIPTNLYSGSIGSTIIIHSLYLLLVIFGALKVRKGFSELNQNGDHSD